MRVHSKPMLVSGMGTERQACTALESLPLRRSSGADNLYTEGWLQRLIQQHPTLLPIEQIEPAFGALVPVCMELPVPSGFADNLMLTRDGDIVLVETKLWRNPEARREVVGQVLDYAKDLSTWSYEELQKAVRIALKDDKLDLFRLVHGTEEEEPRFIDAVSRNLRLGRFLLIIAGDGIQQSAEQLTDFLQRHVGLHFTLSLVEIGLWRVPDTDQIFVQPKVIAKTVQIERAVVRIEAGAVASAPQITIGPASPNNKAATLSEEQFYEELRQVDPNLPKRLQAFLTEAESRGIYAEIRRVLTLKWRSPDDRVFRFGYIDRKGRLGSDWANENARLINRIDLSHTYQNKLAAALPGATVKQTPDPVGWRVVIGSDNPPLTVVLDHAEAWLSIMADYITNLERALDPDADPSLA